MRAAARRLSRGRHRVLRRLRHRRPQGRPRPVRGHLRASPTTRCASPRSPHLGVPVHRGMTHDGLGHYLSQMITKAAGLHRRHHGHPARDAHRRGGELPARRAARWRPSGTSSRSSTRAAASSTASRCSSRARAYWRRRFEERGPARGRRRREVPGGRHHRAPHAHPALHGPRGAPRAHQPAQRRRQHRLLQHAGARAARVQEDLQDRRGALPARPRDARRLHPHRARATTCRGSPTASGRTSAWRAGASAISPSTSSSSSRCGTRPTRRAW